MVSPRAAFAALLALALAADAASAVTFTTAFEKTLETGLAKLAQEVQAYPGLEIAVDGVPLDVAGWAALAQSDVLVKLQLLSDQKADAVPYLLMVDPTSRDKVGAFMDDSSALILAFADAIVSGDYTVDSADRSAAEAADATSPTADASAATPTAPEAPASAHAATPASPATAPASEGSSSSPSSAPAATTVGTVSKSTSAGASTTAAGGSTAASGSASTPAAAVVTPESSDKSAESHGVAAVSLSVVDANGTSSSSNGTDSSDTIAVESGTPLPSQTLKATSGSSRAVISGAVTVLVAMAAYVL